MTEPVDVLRFVFTELWPAVFLKPADSLTTNNVRFYLHFFIH